MSEFNWTKESERLWDEKSSFWNSRSKEMWETGSRKEILPFLQKHVELGSLLCDLGCGDGYGSFQLTEAGYTVVGIDVSEEMIYKATMLNQDNSSQFMKGDISNITFPDNHFEAVLAINSLEWTENPLKVLKEMKRVVKENGKAIVGILGPTAAPRINSFNRLYGEKVVCNTMMPWEFEKLARENGWNKIDEYGVYKRESESLPKGSLSTEIKQALTFMWVFMLQNNKEKEG